MLNGFSLDRHRPKLILVEDHLHSLHVVRHLQGQGYRLVKRTGCNNWFVPSGTPFGLTSFGEKLALWRKVYLNTPIRKVRLRLKRGYRSGS